MLLQKRVDITTKGSILFVFYILGDKQHDITEIKKIKPRSHP